MRLRERLEIRALAQERYDAHSADQFELQVLADQYSPDDVLDWLRAGPPTRNLDLAVLDDLLGAGVSARCFRWLVSGR